MHAAHALSIADDELKHCEHSVWCGMCMHAWFAQTLKLEASGGDLLLSSMSICRSNMWATMLDTLARRCTVTSSKKET